MFTTSITGMTLTCPFGLTHCSGFSNPLLQNNLIWQNRSFYIGIGNLGQGTLNQQKLISLFDAFTGTAAPVQTAFGQCTSGVSYWDIGVRGDTGPSNHGSGFTLSPKFTLLDDPADYTTGNNVGFNPSVVSQYCNGSRVPPNCSVANGCGGPSGYGVPPGIVDASTPNPVFSLTPSATVDEGNNWINVSWGPLALSDDSVTGGANANYGGGALFANYALASGSQAIDYVPVNTTNLPTTTNPALALDFFGRPRPDPSQPNFFDIGAVEFQGASTAPAPTLTSISPLSANKGTTTTAVPVTLTGTNLSTVTAVNVSASGITVTNVVAVNATTVTATFSIASTASTGAHTVSVTASGITSNTVTFTVIGPTLTGINPTSGLRGTAVPVTLSGTNIPATGPYTINFSAGSGITAGAVTYNAGTLTTTFTIAASAPIQTDSVSVTTSIGQTNNINFAVTGPTLTSVSPASAPRGSTSVPVTLTGTNFTAGSTVSVNGTGVTVGTVTFVNATTLTTTFSVSTTATVGNHTVTVTTLANGTTNGVTFTVTQGVIAFGAPVGTLTTSPANTTTKTATVTVSNTATGADAGPIQFTGISITKAGAGGGTFSVTGGSCTATTLLAAGSSCTVTFQYAPGTSTATVSGAVTIADTGASNFGVGGTTTTSQSGATFNAN